MTNELPEGQIRELLTHAVANVEPTHRLGEILARTSGPTRRSTRRAHWQVTGGAVLATAAAVAAFVVVGNLGGNEGATPGPASDPSLDPALPVEMRAIPAYYIGETPEGQRLFREFADVNVDIPKLDAALGLIEHGALDPDYSTAWGPSSFAGANVQDDVIYVDLADEALHDRPVGMTRQEAQLALQQVIYTAQAAVQQGRLPVQFRFNDNPINQVYGELTSEPLAESPPLEVLALVNVTDPAEGAAVSDHFTATGVASSFEATVPWQIREIGGAVLLDGSAMAAGWEGKLYPWTVEIDVSGLQPGRYTFVALTDDPSGGTEGSGPTSDTRAIVVE